MKAKFKFSSSFHAQVEALRTAPAGFPPPQRAQVTAPPYPRRLTQRIRFLMDKIPPRSRVLDLGAGYGDIAYFLESQKACEVLCLEREPEFLASCRAKGLAVVDTDLNDLEDPGLRYALSQSWDAAIAIDTITYWKYPAAILAALVDRVSTALITAPNSAHISRRFAALAGRMDTWPNLRPPMGNTREFDLRWNTQFWTINAFVGWANALGYRCRLVARRSGKARFTPPLVLPGLFARAFVFELSSPSRNAASGPVPVTPQLRVELR
jgi:methionine biosynthesis protein MetW